MYSPTPDPNSLYNNKMKRNLTSYSLHHQLTDTPSVTLTYSLFSCTLITMMATSTTTKLVAIFLCSFLLSSTTSSSSSRKHRSRRPCKELVFYFHDILFNGHNYNNATSAIVGNPPWGNQTTKAVPFNFGDMVVFDDPITLDNNFYSPPVGRAQGMFFYDERYTYGAWFAFSFRFNSSEHVGTLNFAGADPLRNQTRDISVIGGTGDFFMSRGVATLTTDFNDGKVYYFRLRVDVNLYECW